MDRQSNRSALASALLNKFDMEASPHKLGNFAEGSFGLCVVDPDAALLSAAEAERLFGDGPTAAERLDRLARYPRIVVTCGGSILGVAAYDRVGEDLRVPELAVAPGGTCSSDQVANTLIDTLETACLATGARRVILTPWASPITRVLARRGYVRVFEGCAGSWFEKQVA